ncbi:MULTISPECIES: SAM-dependent methyltransferase [Bacillales]|uniref:SAM-dependent methyltransferase n=1 Tax=Bacillales TaxID=1385 RepID=UPI0001787E8D|nr:MULTISPECIES: SAM-dependent methyltransferase [Paenibacillus]ACX64658.1 ribosomal RNA methyltransferase RrmJ/FtsJ [Paenibacillus sp. Y412MC10]MCM3257163.1 SAM-dependent methyltransferase [Paenibacillus lautus]
MDELNVMQEHEEQNQNHRDFHSKWVCTANHGFAPYAQEELRRMFGSLKSTMMMPGEVFLMTLGSSEAEAKRLITSKPPIFLRHLFPVQWEIAAESVDAALQLTADHVLKREEISQSRASIQIRKTENSSWTESPAALRDDLQLRLAPLELEYTVQAPEWIISLFAADNVWYAGVSRPEDNLSDWNGGAVRFQREEGQISRAKFKLLEAEKQFGIPFDTFRKAVDIGAAPGGWTSFLLERGLQVTAVDPAKMHPSLDGHKNLRVIHKNAADVTFREHEFDLLVCDMSWSPKLMARMVTGLLHSLETGGTAVVTVKLLTKKPMALVKEIMSVFEASRMQIQGAKQLFHNRDEITLYMIKY